MIRVESFHSPNKPREECGIVGVYGPLDSARLAMLGLFALQHRGQESAGIAVADGKRIASHKGMGLVSEVFNEEILCKLHGHIAIGHTRYSTAGLSVLANAQPIVIHHRNQSLALAHNGNIVNAKKLRKKLERKGSIFQSTVDSEIIFHLMVHNLRNELEEALIKALEEIRGAYSITLLTEDKLFAIRDPRGFRPLCLGKLHGGWIVASETCALDLIGATYVRDVEPGEIIIIDSSGLNSLKPFKEKGRSFCIFELIYFARPDSTIFEVNVYNVRKNLGKYLAQEYRPDVDLVMPFPDSGTYAALGYTEESHIPFEMGMIRNHYVGRTFIQPSQRIRDIDTKIKLNPVKSILKGKKILIIDDSIVRGTTSKSRVEHLRSIGVREIHMAVSCPPTRFPCPYGIDFSSRSELIAAEKDTKEIARYIGLDSLYYLSLRGMLKATTLDPKGFCLACFTGKYPISVPPEMGKYLPEEESSF
ncbi:MAG: amidophosphoribosyltransferase [Syntrophales bacterium]|nr:amidophosphoribosyltransferase [Syntrophales bacterium]